MTKYNNKVYVHLVWSTAGRVPSMPTEVQAWLWPAIAESARSLGAANVVVGGDSDHVHVLLQLPATVTVAEVVRRMKGASSRIMHLRGHEGFGWQAGYGAFSVDYQGLDAMTSYILHQNEHHRAGQTRDDQEPGVD